MKRINDCANIDRIIIFIKIGILWFENSSTRHLLFKTTLNRSCRIYGHLIYIHVMKLAAHSELGVNFPFRSMLEEKKHHSENLICSSWR